jgi:hypothetical protein
MSNDLPPQVTTDRNGKAVSIGTVVRVLAIHPSVLERLEERERARVQSMLGDELPVYEIDRLGGAWVEKWWHESEATATSHSLALASAEMEIVRDAYAHQ